MMLSQRRGDSDALHIAMVTDCFPPGIGGIENHVHALSRELGRIGHKVTVVTHREVRPRGVPPAPVVIPPGVEVARLRGFTPRLYGSDPALDPRMIGQFVEMLKGNRFDVVHGHTVGSLLVAALLLKASQLGYPTIVTKHSMVIRPRRLPLVSSLLRRLMLHVSNQMTAHIAVSEPAADELRGTRSKVYVIHNAIDTGMFHPDAELRQQTRASLGFRDEHVVIGFMSRFVGSKGILDLVDVAAHLAERLPQIRFLLVGDGPLRQRVEQHIRQAGLEDSFRLVGFQPWARTPAFLNAMDIFAFPSQSEGFGMALLEAMACGLPAVTTDQSGTQDVIVDGETALAADSLEELEEGLARLALDADLRRQMGARAREAVEHSMGWSTVARQTADVYREAIRLKESEAK